MTQQEFEAIQNIIPRPPRKQELGGGYYYKCHWLMCGEDLKKWWKYCPNCGQKILWEGEENDE